MRQALDGQRDVNQRCVLVLELATHHPVAQALVDGDHVVVGLGVEGVHGLQLRLDLGQPAHHVGLEQLPEPVAAVAADDGGVLLVADGAGPRRRR